MGADGNPRASAGQGGCAAKSSKRRATIRRNGIACDVSIDGRRPLSLAAFEGLLPTMRYRHVKQLFGKNVIVEVDPDTGQKHVTRVLSETRRLYQFDDKGRLFCGAGYISKIYAHLRERGYDVTYIDYTKEDAKAFEPDWGRLEKHEIWTPQPGDAKRLQKMLDRGETIVDPALPRRVKQDEVIRAIASRLDRRLGGVIKVPPGFGKSFLLAAICVLFRKAKIAVLVPDQDNFNKTVAHITGFLPRVGARGCGQRYEGPRVNVYTFGSAHWVRDDVDIVLVDEGHKAMAAGISTTLARVAPHSVRFALTATPQGRIDKADARMEPMFGPIIYEMSWPEAVALGLILSIEVRWARADFAENPARGLEDVPRKRAGIWSHDARNTLIASLATKEEHKDDQVLVMVSTIEHALQLKRMLPDFETVYGQQDIAEFARFHRRGIVDADFVPVDAYRREAMRLAFSSGELRKVIATDVWATGVSFDELQVLIRGDARSSTILDEQIPGRASRVHSASGKRVGILYDIDDVWDRGFQFAGRARRRNYKDKAWLQIDLTSARRTNLAE